MRIPAADEEVEFELKLSQCMFAFGFHCLKSQSRKIIDLDIFMKNVQKKCRLEAQV